MKIADGIEMLEIQASLMAGPSIICPTLIWDDKTVILVDTGLPGLLQQFQGAIQKAGVSFDKLTKIIITHHDMDHIGSLSAILNASQQKITVMSHSEEIPYIEGKKISIKFTPERIAQREAQLNALPEEQREAARSMFANIKAPVDTAIEDGEELPYCGGITVIHTPGHTPGHICLYHKQSKTLITGDAMNIANGQLVGPNPQHTYDLASAKKSLEKLMLFDIEKVICYHGGLYEKDANTRIAELAREK